MRSINVYNGVHNELNSAQKCKGEFRESRSHDCGVEPGQPHRDNCDVERCSSCGGQLLMCGCPDHDKAFARWTGFWPGKLEATALNMDLNGFCQVSDLFFVKPTL